MNKHTILLDEHRKLNAKIVPFAGFDMPVQYTSVKEEVIAVRKSVGVFDVSHMGEFFVTGKDAIKFCDYLVTNDIANAPLGKAIYSPLCRDNGTIIDDLIIYKLEEYKILICVNAGNIEKDFNWIKSKTSGFNIQLTNESDRYSLLAIQGPKSLETLAIIFKDFNFSNFPYYSVKETNINNEHIIFARTGYTGEDGFEIFCSNDYVIKLWNQLIELKVTPCGLAARDVLRLEVCYPLYGHELTDELTPLDANLKWTVKLKKENFIGKDHLLTCQPKYKLVKLILEKGIPRQDYVVTDSSKKTIGKVTSGTMSVVLNKGVALALIELTNYPLDEKFLIMIRDNFYEASLTKNNFVTGGHL